MCVEVVEEPVKGVDHFCWPLCTLNARHEVVFCKRELRESKIVVEPGLFECCYRDGRMEGKAHICNLSEHEGVLGITLA